MILIDTWTWFLDVDLYQEWWDTSPEAGPKQRPQSSFEEPRPKLETLALDGGNKLTFLVLNCRSINKQFVYFEKGWFPGFWKSYVYLKLH